MIMPYQEHRFFEDYLYLKMMVFAEKSYGDVAMSKKMRKKKKKKIRTKRSWIVDIPTEACLFFIIVGIVCTVFIFVTWHEGRLIDKSEAVSVSATFDLYIKHHSPKGSLNEIEIRFKDRESLYMDSAYFNATIEDYLNQLNGGETLDMLLHPSSEYIWEIKTGGDTILHFEDAKEGVFSENLGFSLFLGLFGCFCSVMGTTSLILQSVERKRKERKGKKQSKKEAMRK